MTKQDALTILETLSLNPDVEASLRAKLTKDEVDEDTRKELLALVEARKSLAEEQRSLIEHAVKAVEATDAEIAKIVEDAENEIADIEQQGETEVQKIFDEANETQEEKPENQHSVLYTAENENNTEKKVPAPAPAPTPAPQESQEVPTDGAAVPTQPPKSPENNEEPQSHQDGTPAADSADTSPAENPEQEAPHPDAPVASNE